MPKASCSDWIKREFKSVNFDDRRLNRRLEKIAMDLSRNPQATISKASGSWERTKGAYRFFDDTQERGERILAGHREATLERMEGEKIILMVQDTTSLNYACQDKDSGLGCIGNRGDKALGLWLHETLALNEHGTALGIMQAAMWTRDPAKVGIAAKRRDRAFQNKESYRWLSSFQESIRVAKLLPGSRVINIADREGDIYELFAEAANHPNVGVLVRARHDRQLERGQTKLWDFISAQDAAGTAEITVPRKPGVASHRAVLEIRFAEVVLKAKKGHQPIKIWIVEARQIGASAKKALCWRLITNQPVTDLASAVEKVQWYRLRWRIEEFHRVLKSGCKAESRQLEKVERLKNALALDMIIAWRILELTRASRQNPEAPATELLTEEEVTVLCHMCDKLAGRTSLTLREAVRAIAQWGGFLARKSDGEPGPMTLWSGLQRLHHFTIAFARISKLSKRCG